MAQGRVIIKEGAPIEKIFPYDCAIGEPTGHFLAIVDGGLSILWAWPSLG